MGVPRLENLAGRHAVVQLRRWAPFVGLATVVLLVAFVLPGADDDDATATATGADIAGGVEANEAPAAVAVDDGHPAPSSAAPEAIDDRAASSASASDPAAPQPVPLSAGAESNPDCDPATGRIRFPSIHAPPCVAPWPAGSDNGGATSRGVTPDAITVAVRECPTDPATAAILGSTGVDDTPEQIRADRAGYVDLYNHHVETYGRRIEVVTFESSCEDDQTDRADALKVANEIKAFATWDATGVYLDELAARGVISVGYFNATTKANRRHAPYSWQLNVTAEQAFDHVAEYVGKRLWGRNARWAGDPLFQQQRRRLGLIYIDDPTGDFQASVAELETQLARYGASIAVKVSYVAETTRAQEAARLVISKLNDAEVTSVILYADPLAPIFFTQEATRQNYFPEWINTGSLLTDTNIFGRLYDPAQWSNAFGVSFISSRHKEEMYEYYSPFVWHHGRPPSGDSWWHTGARPIDVFFTGVHLAGPRLTPETFRDALFSYPPTGGAAGGQVITSQWSWGQHGFWPYEDYAGGDDAKEIWWDPTTQGKDEINQDGTGMWREVDMGLRRLFGQWPDSEPRVFDPENTSYYYTDYPPVDRPPEYPHEAHR